MAMPAALPSPAAHGPTGAPPRHTIANHATLDPLPLPHGIRIRHVMNNNGLQMHLLEAGFEVPGHPCILLLHGFPEIAYSWCKVMLPLARAGYHVIAPDQRGYGRSTGWDAAYDGDLASFRLTVLVQDLLGLLFALGHRSIKGVVGHDFGASVAAWCALLVPGAGHWVQQEQAGATTQPLLDFLASPPAT